MFNNKIAIDLGTCNSLVYVQGKGVVLYEPSVVAISLADNKILAVGEEAKEMIIATLKNAATYTPRGSMSKLNMSSMEGRLANGDGIAR